MPENLGLMVVLYRKFINFAIQSTFMNEQDYRADLAAIRSIMERSVKFASLSGWSGVLAGLYASVGAWYAYTQLNFHPQKIHETVPIAELLGLGAIVLAISLGTAVMLSMKKAAKNNSSIWNATSQRLLADMGVPLVVSGLLLLYFMKNALGGLVLPVSLLGYGLALYNAGAYTFREIRVLGILQLLLGLLSLLVLPWSLGLWALGFGGLHIVFGLYLHLRYER